MKRADLYQFIKGLYAAQFSHPRITYAIHKNKKIVEQEIQAMEASIAPSDRMEAYLIEKREIAKQHAERDEKGKVKTKLIPGRRPGENIEVFDVPGAGIPDSKYETEMLSLNERYKGDIEAHEKVEAFYYNEFLKEDISLPDLKMIELSLLEAHEKCPQVVMDKIHWMIKD